MTLGAFILRLDLFREDDGYALIGVSIEIAAYLSREHDHAMADEEIPENVDLRFLAEQQTRILRELAHMRQDDQARDVAIAALSADLKVTKECVEDISERLKTVEGRLNTIDSRLARIEKHTGLVKA